MSDLGPRLAAYLTRAWGETVAVTDVQRVPGGASRETYRIAIERNGSAQSVILRRDPTSSLIDTQRDIEHRTYEAIDPTSIPVPRALLLENDPSHLDRPFSIMQAIDGCETSKEAFATEPWSTLRQPIGERKWQILGELAALDPLILGFGEFMDVPDLDACAERELRYWSGVIIDDALHPQPVAEATIRWLERNLPAPAQKLAVVHGDYRSGNFLYNEAAEIRGILDWEMAHLGDPLEDLAWSFDPLWPWPEQHLAGGLLPRLEALTIWERASGLTVDRSAFRWWQVFASLKGLAIWISSTENFATGQSKDPILAVAGWLMTDRQNRILIDRLSPVSQHRYAEPLL